MPIGFKNGTDGDLQVSLDACNAASAPQSFLGIDGNGRASLVSTAGNQDTHVILRGGRKGPNYRAADVADAAAQAAAAGINPRLIVDASHANSGKSHHRQAEVALEIGAQLGSRRRLRTHHCRHHAGEFPGGRGAEPQCGAGSRRHGRADYGQSVTDACMDWDVSAEVLANLARSSRARRTSNVRSAA